jgi:dihydroflavonol-4-reductase
MKILLTGPDGLLGSNLVRELLKRGHELHGLVQPNRPAKTLQGLNIKLIEGDVLNYETLERAGENMEVIFHLAALTNLWPARAALTRRVNIEGTANVIRLAKAKKVKRLIYVGTANSFSFGSKDKPGKEGTPYMCSRYNLDYMDSKYLAHQMVLRAVEEGLPALVVNPTFMLGPYDSLPSSGTMVLAINSQKLRGYAPGGRNFICVKDAAVGIANAMDMGRIGESYIIGNENLTYKEAFGKMTRVLSVKSPKWPLPKWLILFYGRLNSILANISGKKPMVSYEMAMISCDTHYFSSEKAVRELDLPQSPIEDGIKDCFDWLEANGYVN